MQEDKCTRLICRKIHTPDVINTMRFESANGGVERIMIVREMASRVFADHLLHFTKIWRRGCISQ